MKNKNWIHLKLEVHIIHHTPPTNNNHVSNHINKQVRSCGTALKVPIWRQRCIHKTSGNVFETTAILHEKHHEISCQGCSPDGGLWGICIMKWWYYIRSYLFTFWAFKRCRPEWRGHSYCITRYPELFKYFRLFARWLVMVFQGNMDMKDERALLFFSVTPYHQQQFKTYDPL